MSPQYSVPAGEITAGEELHRYYKKLNARTKPIIDHVIREDDTAESEQFTEDEAAKHLFNEDVDEVDDDWTGITASGEIPNVCLERILNVKRYSDRRF